VTTSVCIDVLDAQTQLCVSILRVLMFWDVSLYRLLGSYKCFGGT
jgi:hypothetical protein